jgi:hypothetical protein
VTITATVYEVVSGACPESFFAQPATRYLMGTYN